MGDFGSFPRDISSKIIDTMLRSRSQHDVLSLRACCKTLKEEVDKRSWWWTALCAPTLVSNGAVITSVEAIAYKRLSVRSWTVYEKKQCQKEAKSLKGKIERREWNVETLKRELEELHQLQADNNVKKAKIEKKLKELKE